MTQALTLEERQTATVTEVRATVASSMPVGDSAETMPAQHHKDELGNVVSPEALREQPGTLWQLLPHLQERRKE